MYCEGPKYFFKMGAEERAWRLGNGFIILISDN